MKHLTTKKLNRVLAFALALILTLTPAFGGSVFAVDNESVSQIVSNGQTVTTADGQVRHSKMIRQTSENAFDITLKVETKEVIEEQSASKDAAVVLVLDVSNSMTASDIKSMKEAAENFVEAFVKDAGKGLRYVSIVLFGSSGSTILNWTDANGNLRTVKSKISGISGTDGGTNIEAGLRLANNLLAVNTVSSIDNKYVVLMTDGVPTYYVSDRNETNSTTSMTGTRGGGSVSSDDDYHDITCNTASGKGKNKHEAGDNLPQQIKDKGAKLYTVSYKGNNNTSRVDGKSIDQWLASFATQNIAANADIFAGLGAVASIIVNQAQAWILTDPMGEYIDFGSNSSIARVSNANADSSDAVRKFNTDTNTLIWNLKSDATRVGPVNGWYTYTLTYSIRLDNTAEGFVSGADYAANETTSLTYMITENNQLIDKLYSTDLVVPVVEGYLADLRFVKVDADSGEALAGAKFSLNGEEAISDENGVVSFTGIPSGYAYTLREVAAPEGYQLSDETWNVTVSYGNLTVDGDAAANLTIENEIIPPATTESSVTTSEEEPPVTSSEEVPPAITSSETEPPVSSSSETEPPVTSSEEEPPVSSSSETEPPVTSSEEEPPVSSSSETEPPVTSSEEEPPVSSSSETEPPVTSSEEEPPVSSSSETEPPVTSSEEEPPAITTTETEPPVVTTPEETTTETTTAATEEEPPAITTKRPVIIIIRTTTVTTAETTTEEEPPAVTETEPEPVVTETEPEPIVTETEPEPVVTETEPEPVVTETEPEPIVTEPAETEPDETEPATTEEEIEIEDPEVPLDDGNDIPYTGDDSTQKTILFTAVMVFAAIGMAVLWIGGRKAAKR